MARNGSKTRALQLRNWRRANILRQRGASIYAIARQLGTSDATIKRYLASDGPPRPRGNVGRFTRVPRTRARRSEVARQFRVPPEVAALRDALVTAFVRGDMDTWRQYSQKLAEMLRVANLRPEPTQTEASQRYMREAAE